MIPDARERTLRHANPYSLFFSGQRRRRFRSSLRGEQSDSRTGRTAPCRRQKRHGPERHNNIEDDLVAGRSVIRLLRYVGNPTITLYQPKHTNTGATVIVFPGGGYTSCHGCGRNGNVPVAKIVLASPAFS